MNPYSSLSDDFYINTHLHTEMDLPNQRETVLHYFEQLQKRYPKMGRFYQRERGEFILEEDRTHGAYRWASVEQKRICSGIVNPNSLEEAMEQHHCIVDMVPYHLSISKLDCESIGLMYGFDYACRVNHNQLLAEAIGLPAALEPLTTRRGAHLMSFEPAIQISLDDTFRTHARINFEPRTTTYQTKSQEYGEELLSVYVTIRRFESLTPEEDFATELHRLDSLMRELMDSYIVEAILKPLQAAIAAR
jgi:hypothetical protein